MGHIMQHVHPHMTLFIQHLWIESLMNVSHCLRSWVYQAFLEPVI